MGIMQNYPLKKAKLPRKRKKQAIKSQGRKWYYDTIKLYNIYIAYQIWQCNERECKFWVNSSLVPTVVGMGLINVATRYW